MYQKLKYSAVAEQIIQSKWILFADKYKKEINNLNRRQKPNKGKHYSLSLTHFHHLMNPIQGELELQYGMAERRGAPWTSHQSVIRPTLTLNHARSHLRSI